MAISDTIANALRIAQRNTERNPSDAQKEIGNYAKGKLAYKGMTIAIENPKGGERSGVGPNGKRWSVKMPAAYGYVLGTEGKDGDHVDVYLGPDHASEKVYVVDQVNAESGKFDEHKVLLSYPSKSAALADYQKAFSDGKAKDRIGAVTEMSVDQFKAWVKSGKTKQPLGDLRMKRADGGRVQEEARPYEPSTWREAITDKLKDLVQMIPGGDSRGGMSAAQGAGDVLSGLVAPIGVQHGAINLREGVRSGNMDRAASGVQDIGLGIAPYGLAALLPKMTARGALSEYKAGQAPQKDIWSKENMARGKDRAYDAEKTGNKSVDNQASKINEKRKAEGKQPVTADDMNYAVDQLPAWQRLAVRYGGMGNGRSAWLQPGHLALQGGNVALQDYLFDGGFMPWSWNAPGTVQNEARKIFAEPIKERPSYQTQHDPLKYTSSDPITRHVADVWNEAALPSQAGIGAMAAGVAALPFRRLRPLGAALGVGGAGAMLFNPNDPAGLAKSHDAWLEFERGSNAIQRDPVNYADGGAVSPADAMLSGYADGGAPDWRSDMDAPRPHYHPETGEWIEPRPATMSPGKMADDKIIDAILNYGSMPAKMATSVAMQPVTAGLALGEALNDPTIPNVTNAGVQGAMAFLQPMRALKMLGLGYGAATAKDLGLLPFSGEASANDGLNDDQRKRLTQLQKQKSLSRTEREEKNKLIDMQSQAARIALEADAQARLKKSIFESEGEAAKKKDEQAEFNRSVSAAERARDAELGRERRFSDTEMGKVWDKTGGWGPALIGAGLGGLSRAATGGGSALKNYGLPATVGGIGGAASNNIPLAYNAFMTEPDNPQRRAYEAYARELPASHPRKGEFAEFARGLPEGNPVRAQAAKELYDPVKAAERMLFGAIEGVGGGIAGSDLMRMPGRIIDSGAALPGRVLKGYNEGIAEARGAIPALEARTAPQALDVDPLQAALSVARDRRLIDPPAPKGPGARGEGPSPSSATGSNLSSASDAPPKKPRKPSEPKEQGKGGKLPTNKEVKAVEEELRGMTAVPDASSGRASSAWLPAEPPLAALPAPEPTVIVKTPRQGGGWYSRNENGRFRGGTVKAKMSPVEKGLNTARQYATGGAVLAGPVVGPTGGREDALPVDVAHGSFVVPADVVSHLGTGNSLAGMKKLETTFGKSQSRSRASGGAVPIMISDGEFVLSPDQVAKIGGGDVERGHQILDKMVLKLRDDHIKTLKSLPPPARD